MWPKTPHWRRTPCLVRWTAGAVLLLGLLSACGGGRDTSPERGQSATGANVREASIETEDTRWRQAAALNTETLSEAANAPAINEGLKKAASQGTMRPVFRFYNPVAAVHFYTISASERDQVIRMLPQFQYEGQAFSASVDEAPGLNAVYRFLNTVSGVHFYSISAEEKTYIQNNLPTFRYEGVAYYASQVAATGFNALYRFFVLSKGVHFYTANPAEAASIRALPARYRDEGVGYFVGPTVEDTAANASPCETATGRVLSVGPGKAYAGPRAASLAAMAGDVIKIDAGEYRGDVAFWSADNLTICGVGGQARLYADGQNAGGKAIWVIQGSNITVANIDFHDAKVDDRNGAGIRAEHASGFLRIINSGFYDNENGILAADGPTTILIEGSEFARNGTGLPNGQTHNIYINHIDSVRVSASFFHQAKYGHNFKSRAKETVIENSYLMDGPSGYSSYLVDTPNGGRVVLRGNLLQKGPQAANRTAIAYGAEGLQAGTNTLLASHNTIVLTRPNSTFFSAPAGTQSIQLTANLLASTNNDELIRGGFSSTLMQQAGTVLGSSAQITAPDSLVAPNFWPNASLLSRLPLSGIPDPGYANDSPETFRLRALVGASRLSGALQSAP
ncbi:hypothetical protein LPB72_19470 [Hydrogenophaga crassostreae]|uniref:DUF5648 domain-containing protein n=1 Tax=Hydrogenophaga crassostreae TaxID=1763535 RepID=A0A167GQQ8_9BURK|nr:right-handed parallel beta-helix repeat-containing protein [Hydrogenophaga crassostreae]AOW11679.1 hypothetical protein LPB072_01205 [Hydrogenophaga crassostreae]OAD39770.1 hypothetical protein LPB72_19470 [Hydrogenophaga crassostreae]